MSPLEDENVSVDLTLDHSTQNQKKVGCTYTLTTLTTYCPVVVHKRQDSAGKLVGGHFKMVPRTRCEAEVLRGLPLQLSAAHP